MNSCIVLATDDNYARQTSVTIASYALTNIDSRRDIFVLVDDLSENSRVCITKTAKVFGLSVTLLPVDLERFSGVFQTQTRGCAHVSPLTYSKLVASEVIPSHYERLLLLDSDLIVNGDLGSLLSHSLGSHAMGAVADFMMPEQSRDRLGLQNGHRYFNAGVLLIERNRWSDFNVMGKFTTLVSTPDTRLQYAEQDPLNIIFEKNYAELHGRWNHMLMINLMGLIPNDTLKGEFPLILHYAGQIKPWHEYCPPEVQATYYRFASACPWIDLRPIAPRTASEFQIARQIAQNRINQKKGSFEEKR
jgi:lipopolysaccharide biosynthesis glycosyltransferase